MLWRITRVEVKMTEETFSEISCPLCKKKLRDKKPRTLKQWKTLLMVHLIASPPHHLDAEEAETIANSYFNRLRYFLKLHEEKTKSRHPPDLYE